MEQLSIFDFLKDPNEDIPKEQTVLYENGTRLWRVSRGDIYPYSVENSYLVNERRFYSLERADVPGLHYTTNNDECGISYFREYEQAKEVAQNYCTMHDVILPSSICGIETKYFEHYNQTLNRKWQAFYIIMPGPLGAEPTCLILKGPCTYTHMRIFPSEKKLRAFIEKIFLKSMQKHGYVEGDISNMPKLPILYRCKKGCDWVYSADGYSEIEDRPSDNTYYAGYQNGKKTCVAS